MDDVSVRLGPADAIMEIRPPANAAEDVALRTLMFGSADIFPIGEAADLWHLLGLWQGQNLHGVTIWEQQSGNWAVLWHPVAADFSSASVGGHIRGLTRAACDAATSAGCRYLLAYLEADDGPGDYRAALCESGFSRLASFLSLERPLEAGETFSTTIPGRLVDFKEAGWKRFTNLFERTRSGSLDLAGLHKLRSPEEIITQFREQSPPEESGDWLLLEQDGADLALILFHEMPGEGSLEICYLGVVPEARHRGIGRILSQLALQRANSHGLALVETNVDAANHPARDLYRQLGFRETDAGYFDVFLKTLDAP